MTSSSFILRVHKWNENSARKENEWKRAKKLSRVYMSIQWSQTLKMWLLRALNTVFLIIISSLPFLVCGWIDFFVNSPCPRSSPTKQYPAHSASCHFSCFSIHTYIRETQQNESNIKFQAFFFHDSAEAPVSCLCFYFFKSAPKAEMSAASTSNRGISYVTFAKIQLTKSVEKEFHCWLFSVRKGFFSASRCVVAVSTTIGLICEGPKVIASPYYPNSWEREEEEAKKSKNRAVISIKMKNIFLHSDASCWLSILCFFFYLRCYFSPQFACCRVILFSRPTDDDVFATQQQQASQCRICEKKKRDPIFGEKEISHSREERNILCLLMVFAYSAHLPSLLSSHSLQCRFGSPYHVYKLTAALRTRAARRRQRKKDIFMIDVGIFVCCLFVDRSTAALFACSWQHQIASFFHQEGIARLPFGFYEPEINQSFLHYTRAQLRIVRMWWALRRGRAKGQEASSSLFSNGSACASSQCKRLMRWKMYEAFHRTFLNTTHNIARPSSVCFNVAHKNFRAARHSHRRETRFLPGGIDVHEKCKFLRKEKKKMKKMFSIPYGWERAE